MKYLAYILRNARRNPLRSLLTIGSIAVCSFLTIFMLSLFASSAEIRKDSIPYNRVIAMSSQGFARPLPISMLREIVAIDERAGTNAIVKREDGKALASPFSWFGGQFREEQNTTFAQFGIDPDVFFDIYNDLTVPPDQLAEFKRLRNGVAIGRKLAADKKLKVGDPFPLKGRIYNYDLDLTVAAIYDGPEKRDLSSAYYNWYYLSEGLRAKGDADDSADNAGTVMVRCKPGVDPAAFIKAVDEANRSSDSPTRTQTEDAFAAMFEDMIKDLQTYINALGIAVAFTLLIICGVSMAMSMRERTKEVAILRAIGFQKGKILGMVLAESTLIAGIGGILGTGTALLLQSQWDKVGPMTGGFLPILLIPTSVALAGVLGGFLLGLLGGYWPALRASSIPVVDGLRKVV